MPDGGKEYRRPSVGFTADYVLRYRVKFVPAEINQLMDRSWCQPRREAGGRKKDRNDLFPLRTNCRYGPSLIIRNHT